MRFIKINLSLKSIIAKYRSFVNMSHDSYILLHDIIEIYKYYFKLDFIDFTW